MRLAVTGAAGVVPAAARWIERHPRRAGAAALLTTAVAAGRALARRERAVLPLLAVYLLSGWIVAGFSLNLAWYRYWNSAFGSFLTAIALVALADRGTGTQKAA